jgi:alanine dehydrogenase
MKIRIGIRREDKNPWEKRVPLIPAHVKEIIRKFPLDVWLQPSEIRVFSDRDYRDVGAQIREDLSSCSVVFAVKEIPLDFFHPGGTYVFFSHTIKGQPFNMPMLRKMMDMKCTLIDYERVVDENGRRLVFFGKQAGQAGMIDTMWAFGQRLKRQGIPNPFGELQLSHQYKNLEDAKESVRNAGEKIKQVGLDPLFVPLICGFAGYGHVSLGAQEIFDLLPSEEITPKDLGPFVREKKYADDRVYKAIFKEEHMVEPRSSMQKFDLQEYYDHPERYRSIFEGYLPHLTILVNCIYWTPRYPHFVTKKYLNKLWQGQATPRLTVIGDISCDVEGAIEITSRATSPGEPVYVFDPVGNRETDGLEGRGVVVMATDNLPAELSLESSLFFSNVLSPFVPAIAMADYSGTFEGCGLPYPIKRAVILYRGKLTPEYEFMKEYV